jgi:hypothetical protein
MPRKIGLIVVVTAAFLLTVVTTALCATPVVVLLTRSYQPKVMLAADGPYGDTEDFGRTEKSGSRPVKQDSEGRDTPGKTWCDSNASTLSPGFEGDNSDALAACNQAFEAPRKPAK